MTAQQRKWLTGESLEQIKKWKENKLTDAQIAANMGISHSTLCNWKNLFPEFGEAFIAGKVKIIQEAEEALYKVAFGYNAEETRITGKVIKDVKIPEKYETVTKHIKPDITALIFLLTNMDRENWKRNTDNAPPEAKMLNKIELFAQGKKQGRG